MSGQEAVATTDANPRAPGPRAPAPNQSDTERDTPILSLLSPDPDHARATTSIHLTGRVLARRRERHARVEARQAHGKRLEHREGERVVHVEAVLADLAHLEHDGQRRVVVREAAPLAVAVVVRAPLVGLDRRRRDELEVFDRGDGRARAEVDEAARQRVVLRRPRVRDVHLSLIHI